jgi:hypothetical protein
LYHHALPSYLGGFVATQEDAVQFAALEGTVPTGLPNLGRWLRHMATYTPAERAAFPPK